MKLLQFNIKMSFQISLIFFLLQVSLEEIFPELYGDSVKQMSLTLLYEGMGVEKGFTVSIKPMEMYSFLLRR